MNTNSSGRLRLVHSWLALLLVAVFAASTEPVFSQDEPAPAAASQEAADAPSTKADEAEAAPAQGEVAAPAEDNTPETSATETSADETPADKKQDDEKAATDTTRGEQPTDEAPTTGSQTTVSEAAETPSVKTDDDSASKPDAGDMAEIPTRTDATPPGEGTDAAEDTAPVEDPFGALPAKAKADDEALLVGMPWYQKVGIGLGVLALIVVPFFIGGTLADRLRMPDHGWKIGLILGSLLWAGTITYFGWPPKLGPDLSGGINLIYEVDPRAERKEDFDIQQMINALILRVNPGGVKEVTIRPYGPDQVEIIIPKAGESELDYIMRQISTAGSLQFRINANYKDHEDLIRLAYETEENDIIDDGVLIGHWSFIDLQRFNLVADSGSRELQDLIALARETPGRVVGDKARPRAYWLELDPTTIPESQRERAVVRRTARGTLEVLLLSQVSDQSGGFVLRADPQGRPQVLMAMDEYNVTGDLLDTAASAIDNDGRMAVSFSFKSRGATLFARLTTENQPDTLGFHRQLGILLDDTLLSAPQLNEPITGGMGQISGNFTQEEIDFLVSILNAGSLPAALNKVPISNQTTSPELGIDTVTKGAWSMAISLAAVFVFVLVYYRFAGLLACFALASNILLMLAVMISIKAAFTLPGLAGMVLTVGMAVDANVLIYERMREELARGTALRMAIRNGFERATTAIVDSNLTTLITAVVLYWIGTDQIKGFAVTLILGIVMSMFTAIFCTRVIFEIAERRRWVTNLRMMKMLTNTNYDFLGARYPAIIVSLVIIGIGFAAMIGRGKNILDIDFVGGSSVTVQFQEPQDIADVRVHVASAVEKLEASLEERIAEAEKARPRIESEVRERLETSATFAEKSTDEKEAIVAEEVQRAISAEYPEVDVVVPVDVSVVGIGDDGDEYKIDTSILDFNLAQRMLKEEFGDKLLRNSLKFEFLSGSSEDAPAAKSEPKVGRQNPPGDNELAFAEEALAALLAQNTDTASDAAPSLAAEDDAQSPPATDSAADSAEEKSVAKSDDDAAEAATEEKEAPAPTTESAAKAPAEAAPQSPPDDATPAKDGEGEKAKTEEDASDTAPVDTVAPAEVTIVKMTFGQAINHDAVAGLIQQAMESEEIPRASFQVTSRDAKFTPGSDLRLLEWELSVGFDRATAERMLTQIAAQVSEDPVFPSSSNIGGKVAGDTQVLAAYAMFVSLLAIVAYIWFRFSGIKYGVAAVVALVHDVLVTLGMIALSSYLIQYLPFIATPLMIDPFKISLPIVAALLTIVGYSLNDTIVIFDRIREVKGKSPHLTSEMMNVSINQTLSRTILTSLTSLMVVVILYFLGGPGIHGFAFSLVVGMIAGVYSTIFIACPVLDWLTNPSTPAKQRPMKAEVAAR